MLDKFVVLCSCFLNSSTGAVNAFDAKMHFGKGSTGSEIKNNNEIDGIRTRNFRRDRAVL